MSEKTECAVFTQKMRSDSQFKLQMSNRLFSELGSQLVIPTLWSMASIAACIRVWQWVRCGRFRRRKPVGKNEGRSGADVNVDKRKHQSGTTQVYEIEEDDFELQSSSTEDDEDFDLE